MKEMASDLLFLRKTINPWSDTHFVLIVDQGYSACNFTKVGYKLSLLSGWLHVETFMVLNTFSKITIKESQDGKFIMIFLIYLNDYHKNVWLFLIFFYSSESGKIHVIIFFAGSLFPIIMLYCLSLYYVVK